MTLLLAVGAGLLSFVSPCVLPLLPAYLGYITGLTAEELQDRRDAATRVHTLGRSLAFVLGLSLVFALLGASASVLGQVLARHQSLVLKVAGLVVVLFGLHTLGLIRIPLLYREKRATFGGAEGSYLGALLLGAAFATGWTPCIGPFLAGLLALASQEQTTGQGMLLLFVYGLGLGIPFVLAGLALGNSLRLLRSLRARMQSLEIVSGLVLVGMGLLIFSDRLSLISSWLTGTFGNGFAT
ncbi:MAG: cytochrome c biogenesis protein CcdA [Chloroflexi bacterium]|nr:cytochrome c biogenesis protein CcdA [Chloroflexota bacterium]